MLRATNGQSIPPPAIGDLNQAIVMAPRNPLIFEGLGLAFLRQGQFDQTHCRLRSGLEAPAYSCERARLAKLK
jgi:lipoprotein NlpI